MARPTWRDRLLAAAGSRLQAWGARLLARVSPDARARAEPSGGPPAHWLELLQQSEVPLDWQGVDALEPPMGYAVAELPAEEAPERTRATSPMFEDMTAPGQPGRAERVRRADVRHLPAVRFEPVGQPEPPAMPDYELRPAAQPPPTVVFDGWDSGQEAPDPPQATGSRPPAGPRDVSYQAPERTPEPGPWSDAPLRQPATREEPAFSRPTARKRATPEVAPEAGQAAPPPRPLEPPTYPAARQERRHEQPQFAVPAAQQEPPPPPTFRDRPARRARRHREAAESAPTTLARGEARRAPDSSEPGPDRPVTPLWTSRRKPDRAPDLDLFAADLLPADLWPELPEAPAEPDAGDDPAWQTLLREQRDRR